MIAPTPLTHIMVRFARQGDEQALARLAERDSRAVPDGALLVAEADGEIRAALPLDGACPVADPFHPTADLVRLLELRRSQLDRRAPARPPAPRRRLLVRLVPAFVGRLTRR